MRRWLQIVALAVVISSAGKKFGVKVFDGTRQKMFVNEKRIFTFLTLARIFKSQIGYTDGYLYFKHRRNDATHNRFISTNEIFFFGANAVTGTYFIAILKQKKNKIDKLYFD
jgi:hypothetical protein